MQESDKAYIAGFFDGEGCVYIYNRKRGKQENQYEPVIAIQLYLELRRLKNEETCAL